MKTQKETTDFLQEFEDHFIPTQIDKSPVPIKILGYGEISTVIGFKVEAFQHQAFKRLPLFSSEEEASGYARLYLKYSQMLTDAGINQPQSNAYWVKGHRGKYVAYLSQERLNSLSIGNKIIQNSSKEEALQLIELVIKKMLYLWKSNQKNPDLLLGLDAQISNWAVKDYQSDKPLSKKTGLLFIDTSTPFIRKNGIEQMNPLLFLQSAPRPMRPVLRKFFLQEIMDRYYDFRLVAIDLAANLFKEQRPDLISDCVTLINELGGAFLKDKPLETAEIVKYYKEDKFIWQLFLGVRRADRWLNTKLLGKQYEFTLPGKIKR